MKLSSQSKLRHALLGTTLALAISVPNLALAEAKHPAVSTVKHQITQVAQPQDKLVPLRTITDALSADIQWNGKTRTVTVSHENTRFELKIGEAHAVINDKTAKLSHQVKLINDRTHVPLQFLNETFGLNISWNGQSVQVEQAALETLAKQFIKRTARGDIEHAKQHFNTNLSDTVSDQMIKDQWNTFVQTYGGLPEQLDAVYFEQNAVHDTIHLLYKGPIQISVRFDKQGQIDDFTLLTEVNNLPDTYTLPDYAKPDLYTETEVIVGTGTFAAPGTLTMPKGEGPFPVALLVHGSGRVDRDETVFKMRIFEDMAVGLASQGIAVLRYDKRNLEHDQKLRALPFGLKEEAIEDAVTAVDMLSDFPGIDPNRIFVVGHSQGGMLVPYILKEDTNNTIAGAISMSGPTRLKQDIQFNGTYRYQNGWISKEVYDQWMAETELMEDTTFTLDDPRTLKIFDKNWVVSLHDMHPAEESKNQTTPLFLMQGGRDFQVPVASFENWKQVIGDRPNVTTKLYPLLSHFYTEGTGEGELSTPMELNMEDHLEDYVINDMVEWIKTTQKK